MIGAIIGDVVGSRFEFNNIKTKKFELFTNNSRFTDDTVLTIAVADWLMNAKNKEDIKEASSYLQKWARKYPNAGYGGHFYRWKDERDPKPYNSYGNGSAMRISSVGFLAKSEEEVIKLSNEITSPTHNHPEGLKGAETVAMMIFKARMGASKEELKAYALSKYPEISKLNYDELVKTYAHEEEICQKTVPQALYCFLNSDSFEDCLRTTISIGGDCDTTSAMSCAIAEAYYGLPQNLRDEVLNYLSDEMIDVLQGEYNLNKLYSAQREIDNKYIKKVICPKCHHEFETICYKKVDNKFQDEILANKFFEVACPHCNNHFNDYYSLTYKDKNKNFEIDFGWTGKLIKLHQKHKDNGLRHYGVDNNFDLCTYINALTHDLNPLIIKTYSLGVGDIIKEKFKCDSSITTLMCIDEKLIFVSQMETDGKYDNKTYPFHLELYEKICADNIKKSEMVDNYYLSDDDNKQLFMIDEELISNAKEKNNKLAIIDQHNDFPLVVKIPDFVKENYKTGDVVTIHLDDHFEKGVIDEIIENSSLMMNLFYSEDFPTICYKTRDLELETTLNSQDELNNTLLNKYLRNQAEGGKFNLLDINNPNVLLGIDAKLEFNDNVPQSEIDKLALGFKEDEMISLDSNTFKITSKPLSIIKNNLRLLCLYSEQEELTKNDASRAIYSLDDVIDYVMNNVDRYDGIVFNPESTDLIIKNNVLARYQSEKIMVDEDKMKKIIPLLTDKEISYIGEFNYKCMYKVYLEMKNPGKIAIDLNVNKKEVDDALDHGYHLLKRIVIDNYQFENFKEEKENEIN